MALQVRLLSAFVRKRYVELHYPGGRQAFERDHLLGAEDPDLYSVVAMSGSEIESCVERIGTQGFDTNRFVAVGDMWVGPLKLAQGIEFYASGATSLPPEWFVKAEDGGVHV